ncbi:unnamed protein product [Didymodactylos carnosus]|nr:unnamed protein product [Didymodactylos carnosus]CAF3813996.1 unnamed protein product [Didymodactylos carnosus]
MNASDDDLPGLTDSTVQDLSHRREQLFSAYLSPQQALVNVLQSPSVSQLLFHHVDDDPLAIPLLFLNTLPPELRNVNSL